MNQTFKGYLLGLISAITYGMNPLFGIHLYREGMTPLSVLFYRFFFASILLGVFMLIRKRSFRIPKHMLFSVLIGGLLVGSCCLLWFFSFNQMDSGIGAAIMFVYPVMVAAIMFFFGEKIHWKTVVGLFLALAGVCLLCRPSSGAKITAPGVLFVILSALLYAIYIVQVRVSRLKEIPAETLTFYAMAISCISILIVLKGGANLQMLPSLSALGNALGLALFPSFISFFFMALAVKYIGATKTSIIGAMEPVTAVCIGILVFHEASFPGLFAGVIMILAAVFLVICGKDVPQKE